MENIYLKLYQLMNKQAPQIKDKEMDIYHPAQLDVSENELWINPEQAKLYKQVLGRAKKDEVITPYSKETFEKAKDAMISGWLKLWAGDISEDFKEELLRKYSTEE